MVTSAGSWMPLELDGEVHWIPGGSAPATSVGVHFLSLPKILETVIFDGMDMRTGGRIFPAHGPRRKNRHASSQEIRRGSDITGTGFAESGAQKSGE